MKLLREIFLGEEKIFTVNAVLFNVMILAASVLFLYLFSYSTSPRYSSWGDDSAIFQAVGRCWAEGVLPYVGAFENKGPLLFAIDALGYAIAPRVGIMLLQIPAMYVSMLMAWRALGVFLSGKARVAAAAFMIVFDANFYLDGNRTEEWSMPFLMAATYFFLRTLRDSTGGKIFLPPKIGFVYGVGFGACVLLRATNAAPICCYVLLTAIFLLRARSFKNLRQNFLNFVAGAAMICLPFVVYFAAHGALYEMLYGTILLNVLYTAGTEHYPLNMLYFFYVTVNFLPLLVLLAVTLTGLLRERTRLLWSCLFVGGAMLLFMMSLRPYTGYCAFLVPIIPLMFIAADRVREIYSAPFKNLWRSKNFSLSRLAIKFFALCTIAALCFPFWVYTKNFYNRTFDPTIEDHTPAILKLKAIIPKSERDSFVTWGPGGFIAEWTLTTGLRSREKFFGYIKAFGETDPSIRAAWFKSVEDNPPLWVLYCWRNIESRIKYKEAVLVKYLGSKDAELEQLLAKKYSLKSEVCIFPYWVKLYRLRD